MSKNINSIRTELEEMIMKIKKKISNIDNILNTNRFNNEDILKKLNLIQNDLNKCENECNKFLSIIESSNIKQNELERQQLFYTKLQKLINTQKDSFKNLITKYKNLSQNNIDNNSDEDKEFDNDDENDYMIPKQQIMSLNNLVQNKNKAIDNIHKKTLLINQISKEVNMITYNQEMKLNDVENNIQNVEENTKEAFQTLLKTALFIYKNYILKNNIQKILIFITEDKIF
jgi:hypothetical protein